MTQASIRTRWIIRGAVVALAALHLATFGAERVDTAGKNKLDRELVRALKERTESTRRVIIRTAPGGRDRVNGKLDTRGRAVNLPVMSHVVQGSANLTNLCGSDVTCRCRIERSERWRINL